MRLIIFLLSFLILISNSSLAANQIYKEEIVEIENYLNGLSSLKADFIQTSSTGKKISGVFMLKRPGKLRFDYDPPIEDFIVADGSFIHYYDGEMKQRSSTPIDNSLASFFLRKKIKLSEEVEVSNLKSSEKNFEITITQKDNSLAGSLTLFINKKPMKLHKWKIVDVQGITTWIELQNIEFVNKFDKNLFYYYDPEKKKMFVNK